MGAESMKLLLRGSAFALLSTATIAKPVPIASQSGIFTNEEETYFDDLAKRPTAPWISVNAENNGKTIKLSAIDAFQKPLVDSATLWTLAPIGHSKDRLRLFLPDGRTTVLRRARPVSCWIAIRKDKPKADGSEDWYFARDVKLHDQGGRAIVGGEDTGAQPVMIRMRNVTWDKGSTNAPVVSLYIHKPENWDKAEAYSWAAPDSARVGINLRWVQTGCAIEGLGTPSKLSTDTFKTNEEAKAK
jgi:hypothetical protein